MDVFSDTEAAPEQPQTPANDRKRRRTTTETPVNQRVPTMHQQPPHEPQKVAIMPFDTLLAALHGVDKALKNFIVTETPVPLREQISTLLKSILDRTSTFIPAREAPQPNHKPATSRPSYASALADTEPAHRYPPPPLAAKLPPPSKASKPAQPIPPTPQHDPRVVILELKTVRRSMWRPSAGAVAEAVQTALPPLPGTPKNTMIESARWTPRGNIAIICSNITIVPHVLSTASVWTPVINTFLKSPVTVSLNTPRHYVVLHDVLIRPSPTITHTPADIAAQLSQSIVLHQYETVRFLARSATTNSPRTKTTSIRICVPDEANVTRLCREGITINMEHFKAYAYKPRNRPHQCMVCFSYKHHTSKCVQTVFHCAFCSQASHRTVEHSSYSCAECSPGSCTHKALSCINCKGPHSSSSHSCSAFLEAKRSLTKRHLRR